ncbi:RES family NAD+ phosphorylase [Martelella soudanensis]|uniref:RES family NAD+ phosphorylase n=1 Tax=unclassified Martelella TaxID=2629616 RepID=UPI0015DEE08E|nr:MULTISPECIES: RES family NAD+ phosphorylase [unclassified Martelella]
MPDTVRVRWAKTHRIIRSRFPPIDLFEDIADPADWDAILSAEAKTNPRVSTSVGMLDLVPPARRVAGEGASWAMAPFVHTSTDRPSRFSDGAFGVYYAGDRIEVALFETMHHHAVFMAATSQAPGWTSDFRELVGTLDADLRDASDRARFPELYDPDDYRRPQALGAELHAKNADGILYRSVRYPEGSAVALFWPDIAGIPMQGQHFSYYWDGAKVGRVKNLSTGDVFSVVR